MSHPDPVEELALRLEDEMRAVAILEARQRRAFDVRSLVVLIGVLWGIAQAFGWIGGTGARTAGLTFLVFLVPTAVNQYLGHQIAGRRTQKRLLEENLARLRGDWAALPRALPPAILADDPVAIDLDLFGQPGLLDLLGAARTGPGRATLARWMRDTPPIDVLRSRSESIRELAPMVDLRLALQGHALPLAEHPPRVEGFLRWAAEPAPPTSRVHWLAAALVAVNLTGLTAVAMAAAPLIAWLGPGLAIGVWTLRGYARWHAEFSRCEAVQEEMRRYADVLACFGAAEVRSPTLVRLRACLGQEAVLALRSLASWTGLADVRRSLALHPALQMLLLWDVFVYEGLLHWRRRHGPQARGWMESIGELDALLALAELRHGHPDWAEPDWVDDGGMEFAAMAHPLIPPAGRVANDVRWAFPGQILIITGSNMSGKSTLLRAVGVNLALAMAGAPVCAGAARLTRARLGTSVRVQDSLSAGVSYFLAELHRARDLVMLARQCCVEGTGMVYLLDEVLRGTNAPERRVAVVKILRHLSATGAFGLVTTHDLDLASAPELAELYSLWHLPEQLEEGPNGLEMVFTRRLTPGISPTTNATRLLAALLPDDPT